MASVHFGTALFNRSSELEFIVMKQASYSHQITKFRKKMKKTLFSEDSTTHWLI